MNYSGRQQTDIGKLVCVLGRGEPTLDTAVIYKQSLADERGFETS